MHNVINDGNFIRKLLSQIREGDEWVIHILDHKTADANGVVAKVVVLNITYDMLTTYAQKLFFNSKGITITKLSKKFKKYITLMFYYINKKYNLITLHLVGKEDHYN